MNTDTKIETVVIDIDETSNVKLDELLDEFNKAKAHSSNTASRLSDPSMTLKGLDSINELVAEATNQINDYINNGLPKSAAASFGSKALAIIDPNNSWAGKWLKNAKEAVKKETLMNKTINQIVDDLIAAIETKREQVVQLVEQAIETKTLLELDRVHYQKLKVKAETYLLSCAADSRDYFNTQRLLSGIITSLQHISIYIDSEINPLVTAARMSISEIDMKLPSIEYDLRQTGNTKTFQQSLADLNGMLKTITTLAATAGDAIRKDINNTIYDSITLIGDADLDIKRMQRIQQEELAHQQKINTLIVNTQSKISSNLKQVQQLHLNYSSKQNTPLLVSEFSDIETVA